MKKFKLPTLYLGSFLLSVLPVAIYFLVNRDAYLSTREETVKLLFGGLLAIAILTLKTFGFLKIKSSVVIFLGVFVFSYLLESMIDDLLIFSFLALVGEVLSSVVKLFIRREKAAVQNEKTEKTIEKAILKSSGRV